MSPVACSRLSAAGDEAKMRERKNKGGLRRGAAGESIRLSSRPSSGIAGATIPSDWLILTVLSTLCQFPLLLSIRKMVSAVCLG